jgi:hypothetical protein
MPTHFIQNSFRASARFYTICIAEGLDTSWSDWFDGLEITSGSAAEPRTLLTGYVRDQAELFGILNKLRSLNLTLLSVQGHDSEKKE